MFVLNLLMGAMILGALVAGFQDDHSNSKRNPLADKPDRIKVEITDAPGRSDDKDKASSKTFKAGKKVRFELTMSNISADTVTVFIIDPFYQNRPQLFRGDQLVPYREDVIKLLEWKDKDPEPERAPVGVTLEPGRTQKFGALNLGDWYGTLEPGTYQLTNRNRFVFGGKWTPDSPAITFEITGEQN